MSPDDLRALLAALGERVRDAVVAARSSGADMATVTGHTAADTIYGIDRISDHELLDWFQSAWPDDEPVELVTEAIDGSVVVPTGSTPRWTCIVDPIDGTRGLMYDKRAAWVLAAVAPHGGRLADTVVASMTEIPTTKQWASDCISAVRGGGSGGIVAERVDVRSGGRAALALAPSAATSLQHGFSSFAKFLPQGKELVSRFEEDLWATLHGEAAMAELSVFDDQYLATGGQFHELLAGHDRVLGDVRPLAHRELGTRSSLACHPYDCCTALILQEAGCVLTDPWGAPLDVPLDTTTPVAWVGFANSALAEQIAPVLRAVAARHFPASAPG